MTERHPGDDLTPEAAERLLDAAAQGPGQHARPGTSVPDPLADLLAAASAPGRPDELTGEDAAVAAFRSAVAAEAGATRVLPADRGRHRVGGRGMKRLLTVKAALVALVAASLGGVALAASAGKLPGQAPDHPHPSPRPSLSRHHGGTSQPSGADPAPSSGSSGPSGTHRPTVSGSPSPSTGNPSGKGKDGTGNGNGNGGGNGNGNGHQGNPHGQPSKGQKSTPPGSGNGNENGNGTGKGNGKDKNGNGNGDDPDKQPTGGGTGNGKK
ncbi:hypothetical protein [Actinomadura logoneensis]|uniref:hypothetical protein n=1 Tax=Actinomadura logoneensis TaxID=2293572 RepID=UPI0018F1C229|nr:hypothetical protein [Actinomadura logoneensis]